MTFEGDPAKDRTNRAKHGIAFEDAILVFSGPTVEKVDDRREYREIRTIAIGSLDQREIVSFTRFAGVVDG